MDRRPIAAAGGAGGLLAAAAIATAVLLSGGASSAGDGIQGDTDCDEAVTSVDALHILREVARLPSDAQCLPSAGDVDCDDARDAVDALLILRHVAGLPVAEVPGCPPIESPLRTPAATPPGASSPPATASPPATVTPTPTPTLFPTPTPTPTPVSTPRPTLTPEPGGYRLVPVIPGADWGDLLDFALIPGEPDEAVVARQGGQLYRVSLSGAFAPQEYGVVPNVKSGGEEGLLSIVFSPNFETDGRLYAYYTTGAPNPSRISRFDATATGFDPDSEVVILEIPQPYANHNGGKLMFGQDGYLYLSLGDGGGARDPLETGQDNTDLLGSVLRLKVTGEDTYAVPPDNPFADPGDPGHDLVWAYGLRNPWRMSADRLTGDIWLGDVGQGNWEEVDRIVAGGNYGWDCKEGFADLETAGCPPESAFVPPRAAYPNPEMGRAVTGGYVYRGDDIPSLYGQYIFADAYSGRIWAVSPEGDDPPVELMDTQYFISSFAELPDGELLVLTFGAGIFRLSE